MFALLAPLALAAPPPLSARQVSDAIADVAARAVPAVVHLDVEKGRRTAPALRELEQAFQLGEGPWAGEAQREASGSGVIISADGRIYTNHHVIDGAIQIDVVFSDRRRLPGRVIGSDPRTDVAVVQIDAPGPFPFLPVGDSDAARVGDLVLAIGSPFDFDSTVTLGILSARGRRGLSPREIQDYLQVDAAVNPGSSGGPLLDMTGAVIGLNTAIYAPHAEQNAGISFAIPSTMVRRVAEGIEGGGVRRAWIGVEAATSEIESDPSLDGAEILRVLPGSPAERAGVRRGDVVVMSGDFPVRSDDDLRMDVLTRPIGSRLVLGILRDERHLDLPIVVGDERSAGEALPEIPEDALPWAGMWLVEPAGDVLGALGAPMGRGVLVARVEPGGPAAAMGLAAGDRLLEIGRDPISGVDDLQNRLGPSERRWVVVSFERNSWTGAAILPSR